MVKKVDEFRPNHIGWLLWDAAAAWKARFAAGMIAHGHGWYAEARSSVIPYIRKEGTRQAEIAARMGISKQAVQQLVLDLEQAGIVQRKPDPADRRGKIITFTDAGLAAQRDSAKVKLAVEQELRQQLGKQDFEALHRILGKIGSGPQE